MDNFDIFISGGGAFLCIAVLIVVVAIWLINKFKKRKTEPDEKYGKSEERSIHLVNEEELWPEEGREERKVPAMPASGARPEVMPDRKRGSALFTVPKDIGDEAEEEAPEQKESEEEEPETKAVLIFQNIQKAEKWRCIHCDAENDEEESSCCVCKASR